MWTSASGVSVSGNSLTKTAGNGWGNAGAISTQSLASGDGYVEFTAQETSTYRVLGLSKGNADLGYREVAFAIHLSSGARLHIVEKGVFRGGFGNYAVGDRFRVSVTAGIVRYSRNGTVFYTSTVAPAYPLLVDAALHTPGATLVNVMLSPSFQ